ncbi:YibE/F family protein [Lacticaseibacillus pabuli]|uniref:YibE/F family protein n=1 Tax=Lacticaseibacillus pabuli TaxID=3025672 RepID=A0ABY7WWQ4_9LACO|nr:YibE/F family protein [Lacticaseibacillus sp. KACC 23028]WDF83421.1 YibE/F family protein [Lacticaseibacillus sp. KACC 23028]
MLANQKKNFLLILMSLVILLVSYVGLRNDAFLYKRTVATVTSVQTIHRTRETDEHDNVDYQIRQRAHVRLLNGEHQGKNVTIINDYTRSQVVDFPIRKGQQVFLNHTDGNYQLTDAKRDTVSGVLMVLVLILLFVFAGKHALMIILSIGLNTLIFILGIHGILDAQGTGPWYLVGGLAVIFTVVTALFVIGMRRVGWSIMLATILSTLAAVALGYGIMTLFGYRSIHLEQVRYVTQNPHLIFFAQIVIGALGAVLDEASDISVAVFQMQTTAQKRFAAGMAIGRKIIGPLIAVLFMIFMADSFAESILWLRNGNAIAYTVSWVMGLGFVQSIISAFGIVLAVPITSGLAILFSGRGQQE